MNLLVLLFRSLEELNCIYSIQSRKLQTHISSLGEEGIISAQGIQEGLSEENVFILSLNCFI